MNTISGISMTSGVFLDRFYKGIDDPQTLYVVVIQDLGLLTTHVQKVKVFAERVKAVDYATRMDSEGYTSDIFQSKIE